MRGDRRRLRGIRRALERITVFSLICLCSGCGAGKDEPIFPEVKEDEKLIVYTSHKVEVYAPVIKEFEERTGVWVEVRAGGTTELLEAIELEKGNGVCDIMFGGGVESYEAYKDCFQPYESGELYALNERYLSAEYLWTPYTELPIVFIYNNKLVTEEDAPAGWEELLTDTWKGKIAFADPGKSGSSCTALSTLIQVMGQEEDTILKRFTDILDGEISKGSGEVLDEVGSGVKLIGITLEETAKKRIADGADISFIYPEEGTSSVPDGCAMVKGAPHKENAEKFIDFVISKDTQMFSVERFQRRTVRTDIGQEDAQMKLIDFDLEWASEHQEEILKKWDELTD